MSTANEGMLGFAERVEEYVESKGIAAMKPQSVDHYIDLEPAQISAMDASEAFEVAIALSRHATYLQETVNIQAAKAAKCRSEINKRVLPLLDKYHVWGNEAKIMSATMDSSFTAELYEIEQNCLAIVTRLSFLSTRIDGMAKHIGKMAERKSNG